MTKLFPDNSNEDFAPHVGVSQSILIYANFGVSLTASPPRCQGPLACLFVLYLGPRLLCQLVMHY